MEAPPVSNALIDRAARGFEDADIVTDPKGRRRVCVIVKNERLLSHLSSFSLTGDQKSVNCVIVFHKKLSC
uniref:Transcriptional regulator n=1 Tax=Panagrellus redivivus TaxID=6233 RepID=A0A7E4UN76_PANRE